MQKIIPNGTSVLIFKYVKEWGPNQDDENYIIGVVKSSKTSDDLACHGSIWNEQIYEVLGNDGNIYVGAYGSGLVGNSFFRTKEDHIEVLKRKISCNKESIVKLQEKNNKYNNEVSLLEKYRKKEQIEVFAVPCDKAFVVSPEKSEEFRNLKPNYELRQENKKFLERAKNIKVGFDSVFIKTLEKIKQLPIKYQEKVLKSLSKSIKYYEGKVIQEKNIQACQNEGHIFSDWDKKEWMTKELFGDLGSRDYIDVKHECWKRTCNRCGFIESVDQEPQEIVQAREEQARKTRIKELEEEIKRLKKRR